MKNLRKHYVKDYNQNFQTPFKLQEIKENLKFNDTDEAKNKKLSFILMNFVFASFVAVAATINSVNLLVLELKRISLGLAHNVSYGNIILYSFIGLVSIIYSIYLLVLYLKAKRRSFY